MARTPEVNYMTIDPATLRDMAAQQAYGLSFGELERQTGLTRQTWKKLMQGQSPSRLTTRKALADWLNGHDRVLEETVGPTSYVTGAEKATVSVVISLLESAIALLKEKK